MENEMALFFLSGGAKDGGRAALHREWQTFTVDALTHFDAAVIFMMKRAPSSLAPDLAIGS